MHRYIKYIDEYQLSISTDDIGKEGSESSECNLFQFFRLLEFLEINK